jgi:hypothetical protein
VQVRSIVNLRDTDKATTAIDKIWHPRSSSRNRDLRSERPRKRGLPKDVATVGVAERQMRSLGEGSTMQEKYYSLEMLRKDGRATINSATAEFRNAER